MAVDGTSQTRLTTSPGEDVSPEWSPDGRAIAFASNRDGNYELYVMNPDGTGQARLTRNLDTDLDPAWSPNGALIAFTTNRDGNNEIYRMDADGAPTRLTTNAAEDTTPGWQPWRSRRSRWTPSAGALPRGMGRASTRRARGLRPGERARGAHARAAAGSACGSPRRCRSPQAPSAARWPYRTLLPATSWTSASSTLAEPTARGSS